MNFTQFLCLNYLWSCFWSEVAFLATRGTISPKQTNLFGRFGNTWGLWVEIRLWKDRKYSFSAPWWAKFELMKPTLSDLVSWQSFWCIIHGVLLVCELQYSCWNTKILVLRPSGGQNWNFFYQTFQICNCGTQAVILIYNALVALIKSCFKKIAVLITICYLRVRGYLKKIYSQLNKKLDFFKMIFGSFQISISTYGYWDMEFRCLNLTPKFHISATICRNRNLKKPKNHKNK